MKKPTTEERAYKNALLIGGNFAELDTEINFRKAERAKNNFTGFVKYNNCTTKPHKRKGSQQMKKELAENKVIDLGSTFTAQLRNKTARLLGTKKPRKYY